MKRDASSEESSVPSPGRDVIHHILNWKGITVAPLLAILLVAGCMPNIRIRVGNKPNLEVLETSLRLGESKRADVSAALGPPHGTGRAMLPMDPLLRTATMWSYYYEEGTLEDSRRLFLFVYFDEDRYEGYMWFSSLPK